MLPDHDDDALFADEDGAPDGDGALVTPEREQAWRILLVDDEKDVHAVTRMALSGLRVDGRPLEIVSALSRAEAEALLLAHSDFALAILDVVMEADDAGLKLAQHIRSAYADRSIRIVLRTGQPGAAPEEQVLRDYDINDYWAKTELSALRMRTLVTGNLRSCRDLRTIELHRVGLTRVIGSTEKLFKPLGLEALVQSILDHLIDLLPTRSGALFFMAPDASAEAPPMRVLRGTGRLASWAGQRLEDVLEPSQLELIRDCVRRGAFVVDGHFGCFGFSMANQPGAVIFMDLSGPLGPTDRHMVELFCRNAATAFHNQSLTEERLRLLTAVSRFVPDKLLELLGHADVGRISLGDHAEREMTVLFGDLRSFTPIAERLSSAETFALLQRFHACIGPAIAAHGGIVDKYLGDGIMVLFPQGPETSLRAGADVLRALEAMNQERVARGELALVLSLGAHHGQVTVGTLGFAERMETTVVSDVVNVAARLEQLTRYYRCSLVISEQVFEALPPSLREDCRCLGRIPIKGREGRIRIYDVFCADPAREARRATRTRFEAAVAHLHAAEFDEAILAMDRVLAMSPDDPVASAVRAQALAARG